MKDIMIHSLFSKYFRSNVLVFVCSLCNMNIVYVSENDWTKIFYGVVAKATARYLSANPELTFAQVQTLLTACQRF